MSVFDHLKLPIQMLLLGAGSNLFYYYIISAVRNWTFNVFPYIFLHILIPLQFTILAAECSAASGPAAGSAKDGAPFFDFFAQFGDGQDHCGGQDADGVG